MTLDNFKKQDYKVTYNLVYFNSHPYYAIHDSRADPIYDVYGFRYLFFRYWDWVGSGIIYLQENTKQELQVIVIMAVKMLGRKNHE